MNESIRNGYMKKAIAKKKTAAIKLVRDFFDGDGIYDAVYDDWSDLVGTYKWSLNDLDIALEVYND